MITLIQKIYKDRINKLYMENEVTLRMNLEQFLRGRLNAISKQLPKDFNSALYNPDFPREIQSYIGGTLKHRTDSLSAFIDRIGISKKIVADESFSIQPITAEQEGQLEEYTRQFYETVGYTFDKKEIHGLSDTYFFRNDIGEQIVATYTLPFGNEREGSLLVSTTKVHN
jgi:hypothetical protein